MMPGRRSSFDRQEAESSHDNEVGAEYQRARCRLKVPPILITMRNLDRKLAA